MAAKNYDVLKDLDYSIDGINVVNYMRGDVALVNDNEAPGLIAGGWIKAEAAPDAPAPAPTPAPVPATDPEPAEAAADADAPAKARKKKKA